MGVISTAFAADRIFAISALRKVLSLMTRRLGSSSLTLSRRVVRSQAAPVPLGRPVQEGYDGHEVVSVHRARRATFAQAMLRPAPDVVLREVANVLALRERVEASDRRTVATDRAGGDAGARASRQSSNSFRIPMLPPRGGAGGGAVAVTVGGTNGGNRDAFSSGE